MESSIKSVAQVRPGAQYPASRPGIRFVICVALIAIGVTGFILFGG